MRNPDATVTRQQPDRVRTRRFSPRLMLAMLGAIWAAIFAHIWSKLLPSHDVVQTPTMSSDKPPIDTNVAVVALAVALVALIVTSGQLLGQYFATADGYRRCQPSVMGPWAKRTRLRWRWSQFRFETLFTIPEIMIASFRLGPQQLRVGEPPIDGNSEWVTGSPASSKKMMIIPSYNDGMRDELVCWLPLLRSLHVHEWELQRLGCYMEHTSSLLRAGPAVRFRERSWDFMSPDMVRPHAVTNVSDIAVLARRLGMTWGDFRKTPVTYAMHTQFADGSSGPEDGIMRAEGNGHVLSSTFARSIGIILQYMYVGPPVLGKPSSIPELSKTELYIPCKEADMMGFGILPGYSELQLPSFRIGTIDEVYATLNGFDPTRRASKKVSDIRGIDPHCTYGFSDLISLAAPMMHIHGCSVIRLPVPTEYSVGLTCHQEGFVVFHNRLKDYLADPKHPVSDQMKWVLQQYESLKKQHPEWENEALANEQANCRNRDLLEKSHACWDATTEYFIDLQRTDRLRYYDLVVSHIVHAVNYWGDAWGHIQKGTARNHYGLWDWKAEGMHVYWDYLPAIAQEMRSKGFEGEDGLVHEAWFTMMLRAFCWWRCHFLSTEESAVLEPLRLPSRYWDSKLPVYIG